MRFSNEGNLILGLLLCGGLPPVLTFRDGVEPPIVTQVRTTTLLKRQNCPPPPDYTGGGWDCGLLHDLPVSAAPTSEPPSPSPPSSAPPQKTLPCYVAYNAVGGQPGCIPVDEASSTGVSSTGAPSRVEPITATIPNEQGEVPTTIVTWVSSDVVVSTAVDGKPTETTVPTWVCSGDLCNPGCIVPGQSCEGQDGVGVDGFPWPSPPPPPGKGNDNEDGEEDNNDDDDDDDEDEKEDESCIHTVSCTQSCFVVPHSKQPQTTTCEEDPDKIECKTVTAEGCTPTSTATETTTTTATAQGGMCDYAACSNNACDLSPGPKITATIPADDEPLQSPTSPRSPR
ncbi:hypothetical protein BKA56DRAFT_230494 [Ilyonectria sp. MPI-CAGE-AT-0026]|nr:hypothetical protein BKA56DRAFT_230494 [Ilyonectria sp. MPI-CAGE-AT-0026]